MEYTIVNLSTIDFILLLILKDKPGISGYDIDKVISEREYRRWTDIGKSSVYVRLQVLKQKGLVTSILEKQKTGRGPLPNRQTLTKKGEHIFNQAMLTYLATYTASEILFDLALSGMHFAGKREINKALHNRLDQIREAKKRLKQKIASVPDLPLGALWMLKRHVDKAKHHEQFILSFINTYKEPQE